MNRFVTATAALLLALAVGLAAIGAHAVPLEGAARRLWDTASFWHAITAIGLLVIGVGWNQLRGRLTLVGAGLLVFGTLCFSGTLYVQALGSPPPFPGSAPLGGSSLIIGWLSFALSALWRPKADRED